MLNRKDNLDFERKLEFGLQRCRYIGNVNILPLIRRKIKFKYLNSVDNERYQTNFTSRNFSDFFKVLFWSFKSLFGFFSLFFLREKEFLFLGFSRRVVQKDGLNKDIFHDDLIQFLGKDKCLMIEKPFKLSHSKNRFTICPIIDYDFFMYFSLFFSYVAVPFVLIRYSKEINQIVLSINNEFSRQIISHLELAVAYSSFSIDKNISVLFLKLLSPKKLILTSRWLHYPFIHAANSMGIDTVELQHGCIMNDNFFYCDFDETQFNVSKVLTFSRFWNNRKWNAASVVSIGVTGKDGLSIPEFRCDRVLVISQPEESKLLNIDLFNLAISNNHIKFNVRLHPQDITGYKHRYAKLIALPNVTFLDSSIKSVSTDLCQHTLVVGYTSSVLFEAYDIGCSVGLLANDQKRIDFLTAYHDLAISCFHVINPHDKLTHTVFCRKEMNLKFFDEFNQSEISRVFYEKTI
ncbi:hypothetical protein ACN142_002822 [Vibrio cholerae]|uniref:hypothetical protein n=1 Tax=Vibrio cholerae TaxID=666 RepID=UPI00215C31C5|nr:hypothetical protein [Vibrio cholerae]MCR9872833.1 hypothetical protein [Vibrio cholerae]